jgi:putative endonuclease
MKTPQNNRAAGGVAEEIARAYLMKKGYRILANNWFYGHLEIDIVAMQGDELVITEVKSRHGIHFEHPTDAISNRKMKQLIEAAESWIENSGWTGETRFDLITVVFTGPDEYELEHFEEAFNPEL